MEIIYIAGLYCRLSKDDDQKGESISIGTQREILEDYCVQNNISVYKIYIDDGYSGLNFNRPGFLELLQDVELGKINTVLTKDLSRLGRDYIMTGYYSEVFFQMKGVRYIALADNVDSLHGINEIAPFKNILNDMYARDISRKVKTAKRQRAKQGYFIGSQAPFGYSRDQLTGKLIFDPEAAESVKSIYSLAATGLGSLAIAKELKARKILTPSAYKMQHGDNRFIRYISNGELGLYDWSSATISQILTNRVYLGELSSLKTETVNCKTKLRCPVSLENQVVISNAHPAIISQEIFDEVQMMRGQHLCPAHAEKFNLFRGKLFCDCCGHPLVISTKQLIDGQADLYQCMYHYQNSNKCPRTHRIYHEVLYAYVLQQVHIFAKSLKQRKINSPISSYSTITELTPEIIANVVERIEISHTTKKSRPGNVIKIFWKFR